jgi:type I restriction enzyme M protein
VISTRTERFHYCVSNPPFGKPWNKDQDAVLKEHNEKGFEGRFGPKLPRISDGSMLFLQHLVSPSSNRRSVAAAVA